MKLQPTSDRRKHRSRLYPLVLCIIGLGTLTASGCRPAAVKSAPSLTSRPLSEDSLELARETFRKQSGAIAFRQGIQQLNTFVDQDASRRPAELTDAQRQFLADEVGLDANEIAEVGSPLFTLLDAHYLDLCLLLRECVQSFDMPQWTPLQRSEAAFAWMCRQVRLPGSAGEQRPASDAQPLPPQFVLRRGWGSASERALVFLALLQQLGIDGCMITLPIDAATSRYWLPGALVASEVYLFDCRLGMPMPSPKGDGIATLNQVLTAMDPFSVLNIDEKHRYDVTPEQVRRAEIHVSFPISAMSPRMQRLESMLDPGNTRLGIDLSAARKRFDEAAKPANVRVRIDNRPNRLTSTSPVRVLRRFLPASEGGTDHSKPSRKDQEEWALIPWGALRNEDLFPWWAISRSLQESPYGDVVLVRNAQIAFSRLFAEFPLPAPRLDADIAASADPRNRNQFEPAPDRSRKDPVQRFAYNLLTFDRSPTKVIPHGCLSPGTVRDDLLRGRFDEAVPKLRETLQQVSAQKTIFRGVRDADAAMLQWLKDTLAAQAHVMRGVADPAEARAAEDRLKRLWFGEEALSLDGGQQMARPRSARLPVWLVWVLGQAANPMGADAAYQLALCKHEQAERAQAKHGRVSDARMMDAWRAADRTWTEFLADYPSAPGAAARWWKARALEASGDPEGAIAQLQTNTSDVSPLERTARLYRIKSIGKSKSGS